MNEDPKFACPFCDRKYRMKEHTIAGGWPPSKPIIIYKINCQFCLVDIHLYESKILSISYRLHDKVHDSLFINFQSQFTAVFLHPKQKKIKNPPKDRFFRFNTCRMVEPRDALSQAQRLTDLLIFS